MIGFYNYSVIVTYIGLAFAVVGMSQALRGNFVTAMVCLLLCGLCDMFDGKIARKLKRTEDEKRFGIQIDSLCDLICFGVFPAIIGYALGVRSVLGVGYLVIYVLAALIRLAYFNVVEEKRQNETDTVREYYQGLPVTTVAIIFPLLFLMKGFLKGKFVIIFEIVLIVIAFLFLLDFKVKKADKKAMIFMSVIGFLILIRLLTLGVR